VLLPKVHYTQIPQIACSIEFCTFLVPSCGMLVAAAVLLQSGLNCVTCHAMTFDLQLTEQQPIASHFAAVTVSCSNVLWDSHWYSYTKLYHCSVNRCFGRDCTYLKLYSSFSPWLPLRESTQTLLVNCYAIISMFEILTFRDYFNIIASTNRDEITSLSSRLLSILCN